MGELFIGSVIVVWGALWGISGAYVFGPALYRRRLRRELERLDTGINEHDELVDPEALRQWIETIEARGRRP